MQIVVYELNEVPWRVVDHYLSHRPDSHLGRLVRRSKTYTTVTRDEGELHPWTTWPSLHRGVYNTEHHISFINQAIDTDFDPVWKILADNGVKCGVFGSLQSYPLYDDDPSRYAFYVPDTFSPSAKVHPRRYRHFQSFNLMMTQRDGAYAKPIRLDLSAVKSLVGMGLTGLKPGTVVRLGKHVLAERTEPLHKTRRATMQAPVAFDFFMDALNHDTPQFATFFTNHAAGIMHRYWKYAFPEDFDFQIESSEDQFRGESLLFAMDLADAQLGRLQRWCDARGALLVIASSMGQEAVEWPPYHGEFRIEDSALFLRALDWREPARLNLAMQPDFAFELETEAARARFGEVARRVVNEDGEPMFTFKRVGNTQNLNMRPSDHCLQNQVAHWRENDDAITEYPIAHFGFTHFFRDPGTGYHQPEGILLISGESITPDPSRESIELTRVAPTLLSLFDVAPRAYMEPALELEGRP